MRHLVLFFVLLSGLASAEAPRARLEGAALVVEAGGVSARLTTTADGPLRFTAGTSQVALPSSVDLPAGKPITAAFEAGTYTLTVEEAGAVVVSAQGKRVLRVAFERREGDLVAQLDFEGSETFHGMGQVAPAVALRNERFELVHTPKYGDQTYLYIPFFFSDSGIAVWANAASGDFVTMKRGANVTLSSASGRLDFYVWGPEAPKVLVSRFYRLSNARSLLPRWAYGYLQSRYGYRNDAEVRQVVAACTRFGIPLSAVVVDLYWFRRMGDLDWNLEAFPDPKGLSDWLEQQNVKLITISEPFIARDSKSFAEFEAAGALAKKVDGGTAIFGDWWDFGQAGGSIFDPTQAATASVLGRKYEAQVKLGVDGFWIDLGEPERVPGTARFGAWTESEYHDFFNLAWARIVRSSIEKAAPGRRPFILSRSGWTGIAGLGVATWSGDVPATWEGLQAQVPLGLGASVSGLPFWGSDVGGFVSEGGDLMPPDPEVALRWQQFGAFTPLDRAHGAGPREPWIYGPEWLGRIKRAITLRTALLPYVYSTAYQAFAAGVPMMRPLYFLEPDDARWREEDTQYLFGDFVLVAPVLKSIASEPKKKLRLPRGNWYDAFTLERLEGDRELALTVTLDTLPVYLREGAIIPMQQGGEESLLLLPGKTVSTFTVFTDDGETEAYRSGAGEKLLVALDEKGVTFSGTTKPREITLLFPKTLKLGALEKKATVEGVYRRVRVALKAGTTRVQF